MGWVHLERLDIARHNENDARLITALGNRVRKAWEEERRTSFERIWSAEMLRTSFYSMTELLRRFADCATSANGVAVRCRIFKVDEAGQQWPFHQSGENPVPKFHEVRLGRVDDPVRNSAVPLLFVRAGHITTLQSSGEFTGVLEMDETHEEELLNRGRTQWVEIPVRFDGRLVAKVVLDHYQARNDAFTLGEMRLLARLTRILSVATEVVEAYKAIALLCGSALHLRLLLHFVHRNLSSIDPRSGLPHEWWTPS